LETFQTNLKDSASGENRGRFFLKSSILAAYFIVDAHLLQPGQFSY
jgi:hypothetical protein